MKKSTVIFFLAIILLPHAGARPIYREGIPFEMIDYCTICHVQSSGLGPLNTYGKDFYDHAKSNEAIAMIDSDGDGYPNMAELENKTFPGDPDSYPGKKTPGFGIGAALIAFLALRNMK